MKKAVWLMTAVFALQFANAATPDPASSGGVIAEADRQYLETLMKETWTYLDTHRAAATGFPSDSQTGVGKTNTTNIGLYLASIGPAHQLGYLSRPDAVERIGKIINSVNRLEGKRGFLPNWVDIGGETAISDAVLAVSDFNKLITGLILARRFFPEVAPRVSGIIERVEWNRLYDPNTGNTCWGYDLIKDEPVGSGRFFLASDCRLVVFYMIAYGAAPVEIWEQTHRNKIRADGLEFFEPGYHFGGLFMQAIDAIFLDDLTTEMGRSIADLAWHQIRLARARDLKVWGWSNCNIPGSGYTEGGYLPWRVVTPHASALVIEWYPRHVLANLRQLEAMGLREPLADGGAWGFRDSVNLKTGLVDDRYLCLDQAMLFLSLVNYTQNEMVRKYFAVDPLVKRGMRQLKTYFAARPQLLKEWARRDASDPTPVADPANAPRQIVLDFTGQADIPFVINTWSGGRAEARRTPEGLVIDFDLSAAESGEAEIKFQFPAVDTRALENAEITCAALCDEKFGGIRLHLYDDQGQSQYAFVDGIGPDIRTFTIDDDHRLGLLARPQAVTSLAVRLWAKPWFYQSQRTEAPSGRLIVKQIRLQ